MALGIAVPSRVSDWRQREVPIGLDAGVLETTRGGGVLPVSADGGDPSAVGHRSQRSQGNHWEMVGTPHAPRRASATGG